MGYTVYFTQNRHFTHDEWSKISAAVTSMFYRLKQIKGPDGTGRPTINDRGIAFNGDRSCGESHETFKLDRIGNNFGFCKTARKPYDRYVKAVLCVADHYAPGVLDISCDGDNEPGCWDQGVSTAQSYVDDTPGRNVISPLERKRYDAMTESAIAAAEQFQSTHPEPYKKAYEKNIDSEDLGVALNKLKKLGTALEDDEINFLVSYLEANFDDIREIYESKKELNV